jgi:hypothetical protein
MSSAEFWRLVDHLGIPDTGALELIGYPGKLPASGKRPRFRLTTLQTRRVNALKEVGTALEAINEAPAWLRRRSHSAPFSGRTPLEIMIAGGAEGISEVMDTVTRLALRRSLNRRDGPREKPSSRGCVA